MAGDLSYTSIADIEAAFAQAQFTLEEDRKRKMALESLPYFAEEYLGLTTPPFHIKAYQHATSARRFQWLAPVGHGKSTTMGYALPLWRICKNKNIRILEVSRSLSRARELLTRVREEIETNDRLRKTFGVEPSGIWRQEDFRVQRTASVKESTMTAMGTLGNVENWRGELIIADDIIDITSSTSETIREQVAYWFANTLTKRLEPDGWIVNVGSSWHSNDLHHRIMKGSGWTIVVDRAVQEDGKTVLWPERWPLQKLYAERDSIPGGLPAFEMRFQNNPIDQAGALWDPAWIVYEDEYDPADDTFIARRSQAWDLSGAKKPSGGVPKEKLDSSACVTGDLTTEGYIVVVDVFRMQGSFPQQIDAVKAQANDWGPDSIPIESNFYQVALPQQLMRESRLPVIASEAKGQKELRIDSLTPHFKGGRIRFWRHARGLEDLIWEYKNFPHGLHDDILDALWHLVHDLMTTSGMGLSLRVRR